MREFLTELPSLIHRKGMDSKFILSQSTRCGLLVANKPEVCYISVIKTNKLKIMKNKKNLETLH